MMFMKLTVALPELFGWGVIVRGILGGTAPSGAMGRYFKISVKSFRIFGIFKTFVTFSNFQEACCIKQGLYC
jgi:hypothetical protein